MDLLVLVQVLEGGFSLLPRERLEGVAEDHVNNDVFVVLDDLAAALDSRGHIDIPDGTAIHADNAAVVVRPLLVGEGGGDRGRRD